MKHFATAKDIKMATGSYQKPTRPWHPSVMETRRRIRKQIQLIRLIEQEGGDTVLPKWVLRSLLRNLALLRWNERLRASLSDPPHQTVLRSAQYAGADDSS